MTGPNLAASVQVRLLNRAKIEGRDYTQILTRYGLERLLYRLSISPHSENFVLKGALLFDLWFDVPLRPTRDIDLLGFGLAELPLVMQVFRDVCDIAVGTVDGMRYNADSVTAEEIRNEANYSGIRVKLEGKLGNARCPVQIDIGYGDAVTPDAETVEYPVLLKDFPVPILRVYPRYTVVAEKLEAAITLGIANTRMKDYYDLWVLCEREVFEGVMLARAIQATLNRRETQIPETIPVGLSNGFASDLQKQRQWSAFLKKNKLGPLDLDVVISRLQEWLLPVLFREEGYQSKLWDAAKGWHRVAIHCP